MVLSTNFLLSHFSSSFLTVAPEDSLKYQKWCHSPPDEPLSQRIKKKIPEQNANDPESLRPRAGARHEIKGADPRAGVVDL